MARLRRRQRRGTRTTKQRPALPETLFIEGLTLAEHVVDGAAQLRRQDGQSLALPALRRLLLLPALGPFAGPQKQAGGLGEGPAQVGVADLLAPGAQFLAGRFMQAAYQPGVG